MLTLPEKVAVCELFKSKAAVPPVTNLRLLASGLNIPVSWSS